jgi:excisionase family DNA binding protein
VSSAPALQLLTIENVAQRLSLDTADIDRLVDTGQLPAICIRGRRLIDERDLIRLVDAYRRVQQKERT